MIRFAFSILLAGAIFGCSSSQSNSSDKETLRGGTDPKSVNPDDETMRGRHVTHLLHLRNASQKTAKYEIFTSDGKRELSHYSYHQNGQLQNLWVDEGNLLHVTWQDLGPKTGTVHTFPQHPHKQWWWKIVDDGNGGATLNADPESVPPGYEGN